MRANRSTTDAAGSDAVPTAGSDPRCDDCVTIDPQAAQSASGSSSASPWSSIGSGTGDSSSSSLRSSSRGCSISWLLMKVLLPDQSELELPDGATGLDAARAIGPKPAEPALLVRSNGRVQDLRVPLGDGPPIQILTNRDKDDPDALGA